MFSPRLLDHFQNPRNGGELADPDAWAEVENPACGDVLKLTMNLADGRISEIRFLAKGCVPTMACGSAITELARGKTIEAAKRTGRGQLLEAVGGLPQASGHAADLALEVLKAALKKYKTEHGNAEQR
jgi:nitrogen fixation protein NifU and related proteins